MEKYLVVIKDVDDEDARLFGQVGHLTHFLRDNLIGEFYSRDGYTIEAIYRFDGGDTLTLLDLECDMHRDAGDDHLEYHYIVREPGAAETVASFTARIDGRA